MTDQEIKSTYSVTIEKPNLIVFKSLRDERFTREEHARRLEMMIEQLTELGQVVKAPRYKVLALLGNAYAYPISVRIVNLSNELLSKFSVYRMAVVDKDTWFRSFLSTMLSFAGTKLSFFNTEAEARVWLNKTDKNAPVFVKV